MKNKFIVFFLFFNVLLLQAQTDRNEKFHHIYEVLESRNLELGKQLIEKDLIGSKEVSDQILGYSYLIYYYFLHPKNIYLKEQQEALNKAEELYKKNPTPRNKAYLDFGYINYYLKVKKPDAFVKYTNSAINGLMRVKDDNFLLCLIYFSKIEYTENEKYEDFDKEDVKKALHHAILSKNTYLIALGYNNLGNLTFQDAITANPVNQVLLDSAETLFHKVKSYTEYIKYQPAKDDLLIYYYIDVSGIKAFSNQREESIRMMKKGLELTRRNSLLNGESARIYYNLGYIEDMYGNLNEAEKYFLNSYNYINDPTLQSFLKIDITEALSNTYEKKGEYKEALKFEKLKSTFIQAEFEETNKRLTLFNELEQEKILLVEKNDELLKQRLLYIGVGILSILTVLGVVLFFINRQKIAKQKIILFEEEQKRLKAEKELVEIKQEQLLKKHMATRLQLSHKNTILSEIKENTNKTLNPEINLLLKEDQLIEDDFNRIQDTILEIHPNFFAQLKKKSAQALTPLDLKYAALIYLHQDNRQISNFLKSDINTVRVNKYRLKKKLGLTKTDDLEDYIHRINIDSNN